MNTGGHIAISAAGPAIAAVATAKALHTFQGNLSWRYDLASRRVVGGGARPIQVAFPGVFAGGISAAFADDAGRICFLRGPDHVRFDPTTGAVDRTLFRRGAGWHAAFVGGVDAALWCGPDDVTLFKGDRYVRFDATVRRFREGPLPISSRWPDLPFDRVDSALQVGDEVIFIRGSLAASYVGRCALGVRRVTELFPGIEPWTGSAPRPGAVTAAALRVTGGHSHLGACGRRRINVESRPLRRNPPRFPD